MVIPSELQMRETCHTQNQPTQWNFSFMIIYFTLGQIRIDFCADYLHFNLSFCFANNPLCPTHTQWQATNKMAEGRRESRARTKFFFWVSCVGFHIIFPDSLSTLQSVLVCFCAGACLCVELCCAWHREQRRVVSMLPWGRNDIQSWK